MALTALIKLWTPEIVALLAIIGAISLIAAVTVSLYAVGHLVWSSIRSAFGFRDEDAVSAATLNRLRSDSDDHQSAK